MSPVFPTLEGGFSTAGLPGKPLKFTYTQRKTDANWLSAKIVHKEEAKTKPNVKFQNIQFRVLIYLDKSTGSNSYNVLF